MINEITPSKYHKAMRIIKLILQDYSFELIEEKRKEYKMTH